MKTSSNYKSASILFAVTIALTAATSNVQSAPVALQNATATFSQTFNGDFTVGRAINGTFAENVGWSVIDASIGNTADQASSQTAVFETATDVVSSGGSTLTFKLYQTHGVDFGEHTLGRFRLSVTSDDRSLFADGLATGGNVTANWTVLDPTTFESANGANLSKLGDFSILASGASPSTDIYTVTATTLLTNITGIRLEVLEDPSLPFNGPGRQPFNGNFELSEFQVSTVSVPALDIFSAVEICWPSETNVTYQVQWTSSLSPTNWINLGSPLQGTGTNICIFDSTRGQSQRYYRLQQ